MDLSNEVSETGWTEDLMCGLIKGIQFSGVKITTNPLNINFYWVISISESSAPHVRLELLQTPEAWCRSAVAGWALLSCTKCSPSENKIFFPDWMTQLRSGRSHRFPGGSAWSKVFFLMISLGLLNAVTPLKLQLSRSHTEAVITPWAGLIAPKLQFPAVILGSGHRKLSEASLPSQRLKRLGGVWSKMVFTLFRTHS